MVEVTKFLQVRPFTMLLLYWFGIHSTLEMFNYALIIRFGPNNDDVVNPDIQNAFAAFAIIGLVAFVILGGPLLILGYRYSDTQEQKVRRIKIGTSLMYCCNTFPMFVLDLTIAYAHGFWKTFQATCVILSVVGWCFLSFVVWFIYMEEIATLVHRFFGGGRDLALQNQPPPTAARAPSTDMVPPSQFQVPDYDRTPGPGGRPDVI